MIRMRTLMLVAVALVAVGGCSYRPFQQTVGPPSVSRVDAIDLWAAAMASDVDGQEGADGVSMRLTLYQIAGGKVRPVAASGKLEVLVYDGDQLGKDLSRIEPLGVWLFTPDQMRPFLTQYYGLWSYEMSIPWNGRTPEKASVTVIVRHTSDGLPVYSKPVTFKVK